METNTEIPKNEDVVSKRSEDLPKSIVVILVVLAVAISVLGTFTVLSEVNKLNQAKVYSGSTQQAGIIRLEIEDPNKGLATTTGKIILNVEKGG